MNTRRLSYGLLVTFAAAAFVAGCGDSTPDSQTPPQPSASAAVDPAPPTAVVDAPPPPPPPAPDPPPPPPKPSKDKWTGKFSEDFSGDLMTAADTDAKKKAGKVDKDGKKYNAAMDKAKAASADNVVENTSDTLTWSVKGKPAHTMAYEVVKGDDPSNLTIRFVKDGKKALKKPIEVSVTFTDDNTFTFKDPFAKKADSALVLVFKRQ
jgi:major membrane immunogen (membrane-anchored lipoprotein)